MRHPILSLLLSTAVVAASTTHVPRNAGTVSVVQKCLTNVITSLQSLTQAIEALNPKPETIPLEAVAKQETDIQNRLLDLVNTLRSGSQEVRNSAMVTLPETTLLLNQAISVYSSTRASTNALLEAKPTIFKLGGREPVLKAMIDTQNAADEFSTTVVAKLPNQIQSIGRMVGQQSKQMLDQAIQAYSGIDQSQTPDLNQGQYQGPNQVQYQPQR